ncbi:MAG: lysophospholipid acyltransferase family protein [Elusimicrobia bacterium]|nr:lysophospholipid acyltransferase family protein [Elusimicrobiota bacterium]
MNVILLFLIPLLARFYIRLIGLTARITIKHTNPGHYSLHPTPYTLHPMIYAVWHCQEILMIYLHKNQKLCALVSLSKDGEYMARILEGLGYTCIRGSSTLGGFMSLRGLIKAAKCGFSIALTPDGPKGPPLKIKPGITYLAQKGSIPIQPIACALSRKLIVNNWEPYMVPLPFSRAAVVYGSPIFVSETDLIDSKTLELENALNLLTEEAEDMVSGKG